MFQSEVVEAGKSSLSKEAVQTIISRVYVYGECYKTMHFPV